MRLPLVVEAGDSVRDGAGESVGIGKRTVGNLRLLEVAPASLDIVQLGGIFRQPFAADLIGGINTHAHRACRKFLALMARRARRSTLPSSSGGPNDPECD